MANQNIEFLPPPEAPSLLSTEQVIHLSIHGWLTIDLPETLQTQLEELSATASVDFFDLASERKKALYPASHGTECGFYQVSEEKEYLTLRHHVRDSSLLERQTGEAWRQISQLLYRVLCDLSRAAGLDVNIWDDMIKGAFELPGDARNLTDYTTLMRLFRYHPDKGIAEQHVDIGLLTLCVGNGEGLQVRDRTQEIMEWIDVEGPMLLVGDLLRTLLDYRVQAGSHRVVGNPRGRSSIVFALRPCLKADLDLSHLGGEGVVSMRELFNNVKGRRYNVNAIKNVRERQRKAHDERRQLVQDSESKGLLQC